MTDSEKDIKRARSMGEYLWQGFIDAHHRRPLSFYLLLLIPVVLLLGAHLVEYQGSLFRFTTIFILMLLFFWILIVRAFNDLFGLYRKHRFEKRAVYLDTIGNRDFVESLGKQVHQNKSKTKGME